MYNLNEKIQISSAISEDHPAYLELLTMSNRSEFLRTVLEDLYTRNPQLEDYMKMSKEERMKSYFGVCPSEEEKKRELIDELAHMMVDENMMRKFALETAYVSLWGQYKPTYRGKDRHAFALMMYFVSHYAEQAEKRMTSDSVTSYYSRCSFQDMLMKFVCRYPANGEGRYVEWEDKTRSLSESEKLYIRLCAVWSVINDNEIDTEDTYPEEAAKYILDFMADYLQYGRDVCDDIHTAFLKEMAIDKRGCFKDRED